VPADDREVFDRIVGDSQLTAPAFITYAIFAFERRAWIEHATVRTGNPPTAAEIDEWTANITESMFDGWQARAASFFDAAARNYMADEIEAARQEVLQTEIVTVVKAASSFWKQFAINLATGILAPIIIGGIIVLWLAASDRFPSVRDITGIPKPPPAEVQAKPPGG
jgi:hypothetical protein